jgi:uncharacterized cupredoxin-like copper-binding protein
VRRTRSVLFVSVLIAAGVAATALAARYDGAHTRSGTTVKATEVEWGIKTSRKASHAGKVSFGVRNAGKLTHQFIVLRTNLPANKLPLHATTVNLTKAGKVLGKISVAPGKNGHLSLTLKTGHYVLLCNLPAHYQAGQHTAFQVK